MSYYICSYTAAYMMRNYIGHKPSIQTVGKPRPSIIAETAKQIGMPMYFIGEFYNTIICI